MKTGSESLPAGTRLLTTRDCLARVMLHTAAVLVMTLAFAMDSHGDGTRWLLLVAAAAIVSSAWTWWKYYRRLRRGNQTTELKFFGILWKRTTVTTTIQISDRDLAVPSVVAVLTVGLLTATALGWGALSFVAFTSPRSSGVDRLVVGASDVLVGAFTGYCWARVRQDVRSRPRAEG